MTNLNIGYRIPYIRARLHSREKFVYQDGAIIEIRIWIVTKSPRTPEGYKYSLVYIDEHGKRILGYDNAEGKGHHKHMRHREEPYDFKSIEELSNQFLKEVEKIRRKQSI